MKMLAARWARLGAVAALAFLAVPATVPAYAQDQTSSRQVAHEADVDFVLDVLRRDYAGWPTKIEGREAEFQRQIELAKERIVQNPAARLWAIGLLLEWFEDDHLGIRSNIVSPANPWADQGRSGRAFAYSPEPGESFAFKRLSDRTVLLRVPSFRTEYAEGFAALLEEHHEAIVSTPNLLIDLRGNEGGSDTMYERLMSYLFTRPIYQIGVELRDTPRNLAALQANVASGVYPDEVRGFVENVLSRAAASDAEWIPLSESAFEIVTYPQSYDLPRRVGILTEGAGSSGDQFVMDARFSRKVTLLGRPTAGVIDYSNVITASAPSGDFDLAWPMTRSMRLPHEPIDTVGVPVDVPYPEGVTDQIGWAQDWLESRAD
ncbi:S41 family peptidase [Erythrobacter litoralis]|uniref:Tail specific protease domain-containing protein n=1 Tax=Erythrobacter litoralis (strain HTCC2594) TaxID=314225 RepID=Q2N5V4_ERYLH|nr:S41 family peptidase [Erythrobacter litoralis]ABC64937.1 hypothetical protein ELI_14225 [Erythrobacter litoralis HTCC2594]